MTYHPNENLSGACPEFEARLEDRVSGELSAADTLALNAHLETCNACRSTLEQVALSPRLLRVFEPAADPGPSFAHMAMAQMRQSERDRDRSIWNPFVSMAWKFAATSAVAVALLITFDISQHHSNVPDGSSLNSVDDSGLFSDAVYSHADRDFLASPVAEDSHGRH